MINIFEYISSLNTKSKKFKKKLLEFKKILDPADELVFGHEKYLSAPTICVVIYMEENIGYLAQTEYANNKSFVRSINFDSIAGELNKLYNNGCVFNPHVAEIYIDGWSIYSRILRETQCINLLYEKWVKRIKKILYKMKIPLHILYIIEKYIY